VPPLDDLSALEPTAEQLARARERLERERAEAVLLIREAEAKAAIRHARFRRLIPPPPSVGALVSREFRDLLRAAPLSISTVQGRWQEAVGDKFARLCWPEALTGGKTGGTLTLRVPSVAAGLVQHSAPELIERVNRSFGKANVTRIAIKQGPLPAKTAANAGNRAKRPLTAEERSFIEAGLAEVEDDRFRKTLEDLGRAVMQVRSGD
jgi:hypothetical protein